MKIINLSEGNSLLNQYVAELRDVHVQNDRMRFRRNIERIGEIMAYEMSKALTYSVKQVQTPLGTATASTHDDKIVIATVFRAGLPLHRGYFGAAGTAHQEFEAVADRGKNPGAAAGQPAGVPMGAAGGRRGRPGPRPGRSGRRAGSGVAHTDHVCRIKDLPGADKGENHRILIIPQGAGIKYWHGK